MFEPPERIVDLSHPIDEDSPVWPTFPQVDVTKTALAARDGATMEAVTMRSHTATHLDAPQHFVPEGKTVDDFGIEEFMGEGVALDLTPKEPEEAITVSDVRAYESEIEPGDVVMLHTGWDEYYGRTPEYLFEFPYLTGEAAQYLADLDVSAVGTEGMSVAGWDGEVDAHGPASDADPSEAHLPLLENGVFPIEEVANLDEVLDGADSRRAFFCFPPLNYRGTGGASVRAFAFL